MIDAIDEIPVAVALPVDQRTSGFPAVIVTIYDMCKTADRGMVMDDIRLLYKSSG